MSGPFPGSISTLFCAIPIYFCCGSNCLPCDKSTWPRHGQLLRYKHETEEQVEACVTVCVGKVRIE